MSAATVMAAYHPRYTALYREATVACQDAATAPFSLPAYLLACDERAMVGRVLTALYDLRERAVAA